MDAYKLQRSRKNFIAEMQRAEILGIPYLVVHPGTHAGKGEEKGIQKIADSLNFALEKCPDFKLRILLETTAGQGHNLGYKFEHLAEIKEKVEADSKIGVCLDTCHIYAAGYEIRTAEAYDNTINELDDILNVKQVLVIHVNDSKRDFASRVDRHEHIGEGEIGLSGFSNFVNDERFKKVPFIIETPGGAAKDAENLLKLRNLVKKK
jgi:deoxyribonuclease-4